jgi:hypothetical protein
MPLKTKKKGVQNGFYTARYGLKGCHRAVRTVPATQNRKKASPQAHSNTKGCKNSKNLSINIESLSKNNKNYYKIIKNYIKI